MGGLSGSTQVSSALIKLLEQDASKYKWIAATVGTQSAAPIELATGGDAVMAIGGFNGTDPSPTLAQFEAIVAKGEIHYYVGRERQQLRRRDRLVGDRLLGGRPLQVADRRRRHGLQPHREEVTAIPVPRGCQSRGTGRRLGVRTRWFQARVNMVKPTALVSMTRITSSRATLTSVGIFKS